MFPVTANMKKAQQAVAKTQVKKVTEEKSKDILKNLENQVDDIDEQELMEAFKEEEADVAFNQEQLA